MNKYFQDFKTQKRKAPFFVTASKDMLSVAPATIVIFWQNDILAQISLIT